MLPTTASLARGKGTREYIDRHSLIWNEGNGDGVFFVPPIRTWGQPVLSCVHRFSFFASGMAGCFPGWSISGSVAHGSARKRRLIRAGRSASRISNTSSSTDPGGGGFAAPTKQNKAA